MPSAKDWQLAIGLLPPDVKGFLKSVKKVEDGLKKMKKGSEGVDEELLGIAKGASIGALALVGFYKGLKKLNTLLGEGIRDFAALEDRLIAIGRISGNDQAILDDLGTKFRNLSLDTGIAADEIARFAEVGARFGLKGQQELEDFAETMARFGAISGGVGEALTRQFARIKELTGGVGQSFAGLANAVVVLGNNFATTEELIGNTAGRLAADLAIFDVSSAQVLGLGTAMSALGINAERGGTAMVKLGLRLQEVGREGGAALEGISTLAGKTTEEFLALIKANPVEAITSLAENGADAVSVMQTLGISASRVLQVFGPLSKGSKTLSDALHQAGVATKGSAELMAQSEAQANSLLNVMKRLDEAGKQISTSIGEEGADSFKKFSLAILEGKQAFAGLGDEDNLKGLRVLGEALTDTVGLFADIKNGAIVLGIETANLAGSLIKSSNNLGFLASSASGVWDFFTSDASGAAEAAATTAIASFKANKETLELKRKMAEQSKIDVARLEAINSIEKKRKEILKDSGKIVEQIQKSTEAALSKTIDQLRLAQALSKSKGGSDDSATRLRVAHEIALEKLADDQVKHLSNLELLGETRGEIEDKRAAAVKTYEDAVQAEKDLFDARAGNLADRRTSSLEDENIGLITAITAAQEGLLEKVQIDQQDVGAVTSEAEADAFIAQMEKSNKDDEKREAAQDKRILGLKNEIKELNYKLIDNLEELERLVPLARGATL